MKLNKLLTALLLASITLSNIESAQADITLGATRLIFKAPAKEASLSIQNLGPEERLVQSWLDPEDPESKSAPPFAISPTLSKLGGGKKQLLRVLYYGEGAASQQESMFWLSIQEIPPKAQSANVLQIALRQKIKVFYRPEGLPGSAIEAPKKLQWRLHKTGLEVVNPTAFYISLIKANIWTGNSSKLIKLGMLKPNSKKIFPIDSVIPGAHSGAEVDFESVNDYGGVDKNRSTLK
ncbi:TPA: fimbrial biogenesis chaperone [Pseudomonas aeruginosa]